jgi:hypothetical protein
MPARGAPPEEVIEIATVHYVSRVFVQLSDSRVYALNDGRCIGDAMGGYIVPASEAHFEAIAKRQRHEGHRFGGAHSGIDGHGDDMHAASVDGQALK